MAVAKDPQFVVTLDGLDPNIFLEKKLVKENNADDLGSILNNSIQTEHKDNEEDQDNLTSNISNGNKQTHTNHSAIQSYDDTTVKETQQITVNKEISEKCVSSQSKRSSPEPPRKRRASPIIFHNPRTDTSCKEKTSTKEESTSKYDSLPPLSSEKRGRCRYFPLCRAGAECEFLHPQLCRAFPACPYGRSCAYSHPACRFGPQCSWRDCPYGHTLPPPPPPLVARATPVTSYKGSVCRFYPGCSKTGCPWLHPRPCHFGVGCLNRRECNFYHPPPSASPTPRWPGP